MFRPNVKLVLEPGAGARIVDDLNQRTFTLTATEGRILALLAPGATAESLAAAAKSAGLDVDAPQVEALLARLHSNELIDYTPPPPKAAQPALSLDDVLPPFRTDLGVAPSPKPGLMLVTDRKRDRSFTLYDFEVTIARLLDGSHKVSEVIERAGRIGIPVTPDSLAKFVAQMKAYGFIVEKAAPPPPAPGDDKTWPVRAQWTREIRELYQSAVRQFRLGRPGPALEYLGSLLEINADVPEALELKQRVEAAMQSGAAIEVSFDDLHGGEEPMPSLVAAADVLTGGAPPAALTGSSLGEKPLAPALGDGPPTPSGKVRALGQKLINKPFTLGEPSFPTGKSLAITDVPAGPSPSTTLLGDVLPAAGAKASVLGEAPAAPSAKSPLLGDVPPAPSTKSPALGDVPPVPSTKSPAFGESAPQPSAKFSLGEVPQAPSTKSPALSDLPPPASSKSPALGESPPQPSAKFSLGEVPQAPSTKSPAFGESAPSPSAKFSLGTVPPAPSAKTPALGEVPPAPSAKSPVLGESPPSPSAKYSLGAMPPAPSGTSALGDLPPAPSTKSPAFGESAPLPSAKYSLGAMPPAPSGKSALGAMPPAPSGTSALGDLPPAPSTKSPALGESPPSPSAKYSLGAMPPAPSGKSALGDVPPVPSTKSPVLGESPPPPSAKYSLGGMPPAPSGKSALGDLPPSPSAKSPALGESPPSPSAKYSLGAMPPAPSVKSPALGDVPPSPSTRSPFLSDVPPAPSAKSSALGDLPPSPSTRSPVLGESPPSPSGKFALGGPASPVPPGLTPKSPAPSELPPPLDEEPPAPTALSPALPEPRPSAPREEREALFSPTPSGKLLGLSSTAPRPSSPGSAPRPSSPIYAKTVKQPGFTSPSPEEPPSPQPSPPAKTEVVIPAPPSSAPRPSSPIYAKTVKQPGFTSPPPEAPPPSEPIATDAPSPTELELPAVTEAPGAEARPRPSAPTLVEPGGAPLPRPRPSAPVITNLDPSGPPVLRPSAPRPDAPRAVTLDIPKTSSADPESPLASEATELMPAAAAPAPRPSSGARVRRSPVSDEDDWHRARPPPDVVGPPRPSRPRPAPPENATVADAPAAPQRRSSQPRVPAAKEQTPARRTPLIVAGAVVLVLLGVGFPIRSVKHIDVQLEPIPKAQPKTPAGVFGELKVPSGTRIDERAVIATLDVTKLKAEHGELSKTAARLDGAAARALSRTNAAQVKKAKLAVAKANQELAKARAVAKRKGDPASVLDVSRKENALDKATRALEAADGTEKAKALKAEAARVREKVSALQKQIDNAVIVSPASGIFELDALPPAGAQFDEGAPFGRVLEPSLVVKGAPDGVNDAVLVLGDRRVPLLSVDRRAEGLTVPFEGGTKPGPAVLEVPRGYRPWPLVVMGR